MQLLSLILILFFSLYCSAPEYSVFDPPLQKINKADLQMIKIHTGKPIEIHIDIDAGYGWFRENSIIRIFKAIFPNSKFITEHSKEYIATQKDYLYFRYKYLRKPDNLSLFLFAITLYLYPFNTENSHRCELSGLINDEKIYLELEMKEEKYESMLLLFYLLGWDQIFRRPNIPEYCATIFLEQYKDSYLKNFNTNLSK